MLCEHLMCREQELWLFHFGLPGGYGYTDNASEGYGGTVPPILEHMGYTAVEQCVQALGSKFYFLSCVRIMIFVASHNAR